MDDDKEDDHKAKRIKLGSMSHQTLPPPRQPEPEPEPVPQSSSSASSAVTVTPCFQEANKLNPTDPQTHSPSPTDEHQSIYQSPNSGPVESPLLAAAAQLRLRKRKKERTEYKLTLLGGEPIAKKKKRQRGPNRDWTPPGPSPLGRGPSPHERVRKVVSAIKKYLRLDSPSQPHLVLVVANVAKPTMEKVILMLDEYVERISRSATDEEMKGLLREFQRSVDVDEEDICWYDLIKESIEAFWKSLTEHFVCETFFESDLEEEEEENDDDDPGKE